MSASVELVCPAGGWGSLKAAVSEGADAVYFGVERFNARGRAENFSSGEIAGVAGFCHERGVRAYLALNTLVKNSELKDFFSLVEAAYAGGVDAVILQELSFAGLIKESFPDLGVHVSTQAGVFNSFYGRLLEGVRRVVLPREFTLNQVRDFIAKTGIPVEVFVQGALCFSVGGQCLMSSFLGGRSGNRGLCAQPCRKRFNGGFLLSTRDLCVADNIPELVDAGVSALKIEGRLRSPGYVGAATALYRRILDDGILDEDAFMDMQLAFSREYTRGPLFREYDVCSPDASGKRGIYLGVFSEGGVMSLGSRVCVGDGVGIKSAGGMHGDTVKSITLRGRHVDCALSGQDVVLGVNARVGDEIYLTSGVMRRGKPSFKPREMIQVERVPGKIALPVIKPVSDGGVKLLVKTYSPRDAGLAIDAGADRVYYNVFMSDYPGGSVYAHIPRALSEWNAEKALSLVESYNPSSVLCGDLGVATKLEGREVYLDVSCNAFNDLDVAYYNGLGVTPVISPELSLKEIKTMKDKRFIVYAHGRLPLMTTRFNLDEESLVDERGYVFPVRAELDCKQVLNSVELGLFDGIMGLLDSGIGGFLLDVSGSVGDLVRTYRSILSGERVKKPADYTLGNYRRGAQ
ncbi:MAG: U32 family peptidase [Candidatus Altiarchaeota archaeon]